MAVDCRPAAAIGQARHRSASIEADLGISGSQKTAWSAFASSLARQGRAPRPTERDHPHQTTDLLPSLSDVTLPVLEGPKRDALANLQFQMKPFLRESAMGRQCQPATRSPWKDWSQDRSWMSSVLGSFARRRSISARSGLFSEEDPAPYYYFVQTGEFLVHRRIERLRMGRPKAAVRLVSEDDLFIFDCDGVHVANCDAVVESVVLCIERQRLEQLAALDPVLRRMLTAVHETELRFILRALGHDRHAGGITTSLELGEPV